MTTTAAATCVVAVATYGCHDGSTNATAAGTAIAFPAVVATAHPAYPGRFPINLSQNTINIPPTNTDINPSNTPDKPPFSILARFMLLPSANPTKVRVNYTLALKTLSFFCQNFLLSYQQVLALLQPIMTTMVHLQDLKSQSY